MKRKVIFARMLRIMAYISFLKKLNREKDEEDNNLLKSIQEMKNQFEQPNNIFARTSQIYQKYKMNQGKNNSYGGKLNEDGNFTEKDFHQKIKLDNVFLQQIIDVFEDQRKEIIRLKEMIEREIEDFKKIQNEIQIRN